MENPIKMDDLGGPTPIFGLTPICTIDFNDDLIQGSRGSFGFVWFQKSKKEPQSGSCGVGSSAVRFLAVQETVRFYECDSCAT